ncbi:hypothetical protein O181_032735, partial [Austropuccinia psidii MF-1]|nr:hypothetical protein [Austropuccinia psidii MF-1]
ALIQFTLLYSTRSVCILVTCLDSNLLILLHYCATTQICSSSHYQFMISYTLTLYPIQDKQYTITTTHPPTNPLNSSSLPISPSKLLP